MPPPGSSSLQKKRKCRARLSLISNQTRSCCKPRPWKWTGRPLFLTRCGTRRWCVGSCACPCSTAHWPSCRSRHWTSVQRSRSWTWGLTTSAVSPRRLPNWLNSGNWTLLTTTWRICPQKWGNLYACVCRNFACLNNNISRSVERNKIFTCE